MKYYKIRNFSQSERGFTLIEVLVSSALLVILAAGFLGLQYILSQNQTSAWRNYLSLEASNGAISNLEKELRNAKQSETGSYPIVTANDQEIIFYSDYDYDGVVERVRYTLSGNTLFRGIVEPTGNPLTYNVASERQKTITDIVRNGTQPVFYYYNSDWPTDTTNNPVPQADRIADTREVKVVIKTNPQANSPKTDFTIQSDVKIRMLN